mgnify:CR=1 FL=1
MKGNDTDIELSIIVPVYRVIGTLQRCIDSIVKQRGCRFELILVDDCSDDGSGELCDDIATKYDNIHVIHRRQNGGLSTARNSGIDAARGEYITFVDSDDFIAEDTYALLFELLHNHPEYDILEYPVIVAYGTRKSRSLELTDTLYTDMHEYWYKGMAYTHSYAWNKIYKRVLFRNVRFPEGKVFEDMHNLPALLSVAKNVAVCTKGLYYYTYNTAGISVNADGAEYTDLLEAHLKVLDSSLAHVDTTGTEFALYYAHVLNIQLLTNHLTGKTPELRNIHVRPITWKLMLCNIVGVRRLCQLNHIAHRIIELCH